MNTARYRRSQHARFCPISEIRLPTSWITLNGGINAEDTIQPRHLTSFLIQILCDCFIGNLRLAYLYPTAASTVLGVTYGYTPRDANDEFIQLADEATFESFRYGGPGSSICDLVPFCESSPSLQCIA